MVWCRVCSVITQISLRWDIETLEVESGSHRGQTILLSARSTSTKAPIVATQLPLALQQVRHFHSRQQNTPYTEL